MADKFRQTFPIAVSFSEGELPTATKLTGLATQARSGQGIMQYALGDLWNQAGDPVVSAGDGLKDNALMIASLARYLGAAKHTTPLLPYLPNTSQFTFSFQDHAGLHEAAMPFPLASGAATPTWTLSTGTPPTTKVASRSLVLADTDYYIDDLGRIFTYKAMEAGWKITYEPEVTGAVSETATWNVIPDPFTDSSWGFRGLKIEYKNGSNNDEGYYIYLPPRMPRYAAGADPNRPDWYPKPDDNMSTSPSTELTLWQSTSVAAETGSNAEHYRYTLPKIITESSAWAAGVTLPAGLLYLWDDNGTGTIIEGVTFKALAISPTSWKLHVPAGTQLDDFLADSAIYNTALLQSTLHTSTQYPQDGLKLVTIGSDVASALASLFHQFIAHDHGSAHSMPPQPVSHGKLMHNAYLGGTPKLHSSGWYDDGDNHPQYLERHGYSTGRDKYGNGMMGDLLMNSIVEGAGDYLSATNETRKILFGSTGGSRLYQNSAGTFQINGNQITYISSGSGYDAFLASGQHLTLSAANDLYLSPAGTLDLNGQYGRWDASKNIGIRRSGPFGHPGTDGDVVVSASNNLYLGGSTNIRTNKAPVANGNATWRWYAWNCAHIQLDGSITESGSHRRKFQIVSGTVRWHIAGFHDGIQIGLARINGSFSDYHSSGYPSTQWGAWKSTYAGDSGGTLGSGYGGNVNFAGGNTKEYNMGYTNFGSDDTLRMHVTSTLYFKPYEYISYCYVNPWWEFQIRKNAGGAWSHIY